MSLAGGSGGDRPPWQGSEHAAVQFVRSLGHDVSVTTAGADGGLDFIGPAVAGQVNDLAAPVGGPDLQRLRGAAYSRRYAICFSGSGYTQEAATFAAESGVALFAIYQGGRIEPANDLAVAFCNTSPWAYRTAAPVPPAHAKRGCGWFAMAYLWFNLLLLGGPITFVLAVEARRRSGDHLFSGPGATSATRWRFWSMIIGALGILGWVGYISRGVIWLVTFNSVSEATSENASSSLGLIIGLPLTALLYHYVWNHPHEKLSLPRRFIDQGTVAPTPPPPPPPALASPELGPPWGELVREAIAATARIAGAQATATGLAVPAVQRASVEASASLVTVSRVAENASNLDQARRSLDVDKVRERLEDLDARFGASADLDEARRALREQIAAESRMAQVTMRLEGQLHRMVAQLGEAAVRCDELCLRPLDLDDGAGDVVAAVDGLTALRLALDELDETGVARGSTF